MNFKNLRIKFFIHRKYHNWKPTCLSELTPMIFNTELTHLGFYLIVWMPPIISYEVNLLRLSGLSFFIISSMNILFLVNYINP